MSRLALPCSRILLARQLLCQRLRAPLLHPCQRLEQQYQNLGAADLPELPRKAVIIHLSQATSRDGVSPWLPIRTSSLWTFPASPPR